MVIIHLKGIRQVKLLNRLLQKKTALSEMKTIEGTEMKRTLKVWDLTSLGIAALIGAGIFSTIGAAASQGGPAVSFLFIFTAIACAFSAFCYAEFASNIPTSGSAYTYAYASLGELVAWIIGWDLLMEYAIGNIAVAISWSDYFTALVAGYGWDLPRYITMDYLSASRAYEAVQGVLSQGIPFEGILENGITSAQREGYLAYLEAPEFLGLKWIGDVPALFVTVFVTWIVYIGISESKRVNNFMVLLKIAVLLLVIGVGAFYVQPENLSPFAPNGLAGVLRGVSGVFFAYIGFDAISTTAEECENPQRDLPRAMMYALLICTVLYVAVALVLTGVVKYDQLGVGDPLAYVFGPEGANVPWISGVIAVSAVVALFTVLLVFQIGQPRIWMAMSRDGLLPKKFSAIHPKYKTPWFSTLLTGLLVGIPSLFMNLTEVTDLTSIGTLCAFLIVCFGVLTFDPKRPKLPGRFYTPYWSGKWWVPILFVLSLVMWATLGREHFVETWNFSDFETFKHRIPLLGYLIMMALVSVWAFRKSLSLIPVLGVATTGYLMTELGWVNWVRFAVWLAIGLLIYGIYGYRNSHIGKESEI